METGVLNDRIAERVRVKNRAFAERPALRARKKPFRRFEVGRVEPLGKPVVDRLEECRLIGGTALISQ